MDPRLLAASDPYAARNTPPGCSGTQPSWRGILYDGCLALNHRETLARSGISEDSRGVYESRLVRTPQLRQRGRLSCKCIGLSLRSR